MVAMDAPIHAWALVPVPGAAFAAGLRKLRTDWRCRGQAVGRAAPLAHVGIRASNGISDDLCRFTPSIAASFFALSTSEAVPNAVHSLFATASSKSRFSKPHNDPVGPSITNHVNQSSRILKGGIGRCTSLTHISNGESHLRD